MKLPQLKKKISKLEDQIHALMKTERIMERQINRVYMTPKQESMHCNRLDKLHFRRTDLETEVSKLYFQLEHPKGL